MRILSGDLTFFDSVIETEGDERIGIFATRYISGRDNIIANIDLGWRRKYIIAAQHCYLVRQKNNEFRWEKIDFEEGGEGLYTRKDLKLLPYLKSKGIKCHYRNRREHKGNPSWKYVMDSFDTIISQNGYLQRLENGSVRLNEDDYYSYCMYKTCVNYKRGQLIIDGKKVKRWRFEDDMWKCKSMISWVKKSFRQEQQLSNEEFMSLADKWSQEAMKTLERYISPVFVEFYDGSRFEEVTPSAKEFLKGNTKTIIVGEPKIIRKTPKDRGII